MLGPVSDFKRAYEEPIVVSRQPDASLEQRQLGLERLKHLIGLCQTFVLRRTISINEKYLPPKCDYIVFVKPSELQASLYRDVVYSEEITAFFDGQVGSMKPLLIISLLQKICASPKLTLSYLEEVSVFSAERNVNGNYRL
jgi:DNA repair and recombination protein RAD54B